MADDGIYTNIPTSFPKTKNLFPTLLIVIFLIIGCAVGIDVHSNCKALQGDKVYNNLRQAMNYGVTTGVTTLFILIIMEAGAFNAAIIGIICALFGLVTSAMSIGAITKCDGEFSKDKNIAVKVFGPVSLIVSIGAGLYLSRKLVTMSG